MPKESSGILLYKRVGDEIVVLLVHPGGPFWRGKDSGAWSIPKGELAEGEDVEAAARREFHEEIGRVAIGRLRPLGSVRQAGGKTVHAFALEGDVDVDRVESNRFEIEWPPHSGGLQSFAEIDRAAWCGLPMARDRINAAQRPFIERLERLLEAPPNTAGEA